MVKKTKYAAGIEVESAFGRTDYMYVYEVAPWAYDSVNDWIKVAIESAVDLDISDDWARELGQVDLARYAGAAVGLLNPVHVGVTVAGAIVDPRQIRALTAADIVSAAQSGVWSVGRTWTLTALDIVSAAQSGVWSVGRTWALAIATDSVAAQVSNWPALYAMNLTQYISAACGLLNPVHVGITVAGAIVDPRSIRALTAADIVTADSLTKWGGTALTGRDITLLLDNLDAALSTRARLQPWYQTNFTTDNEVYTAANVAPHAITTRWTYTVPANRVAIVANCDLLIMRDAAPTTASLAFTELIAAGTARVLWVGEISSTVGESHSGFLGWSAILRAAQTLVANDSDGSTGGTHVFIESANIMEFNT